MSQRIHDLFSAIAPKYDLLNTVLSFGIDRRWRRIAVSYLRDSEHLLDLCAGTLALTRELLTANPQGRITAIDFSQPMLDRGLKNLAPSLLWRVSVECIDFFKFTRPAGSFDGAMCAYGMRNLDDNPMALERLHHLLRAGGKLVLLEFFRPDRMITRLFNLTYAQFVIPAVGLLFSRHKEAYRHLRDSVRRFYTLDEYAQLLQEAGFEVKVAKRLTGGISGLIVAEKPPHPPGKLQETNPLSRKR